MGLAVSSDRFFPTKVRPYDDEPDRSNSGCCCHYFKTLKTSRSVASQTHAYGLVFEKVGQAIIIGL